MNHLLLLFVFFYFEVNTAFAQLEPHLVTTATYFTITTVELGVMDLIHVFLQVIGQQKLHVTLATLILLLGVVVDGDTMKL